MRGYDASTYGEGFADVYDDWYGDVSDVAATVALAVDLAGAGGRVLELGVGTGRLARPMAAAGLRVTGLDASPAMLERLRAADPAGTVEAIEADMAGPLPDGPFDLALIAYNTLFNLTGNGEQARCIAAVAGRLRPGGRLLIEAFVPDEPFRDGDEVGIRSMTADRVVLAVARYDAAGQRAEGQFVELSAAGGVRLRPWSIRYSTTDELDAMAAAAGLVVEHRWADVARSPFGDDSDRHVTVYRLPIDG